MGGSTLHGSVHETFCDVPRHSATEKDRKRHAKNPFHNQNSKQDPKNKHTRTIGGYRLFQALEYARFLVFFHGFFFEFFGHAFYGVS
jgi:hypothetical protein